MKGLDLLLDVCRSLDVLALPGRFEASLADETTTRGGEASPVDFHGDVHGRTYHVSYTSSPGEFALTLLAGATRNGLGLVRVALSSLPAGVRLISRDFVTTGCEDDSVQLAGVLFLVLSAGATVGFVTKPYIQ